MIFHSDFLQKAYEEGIYSDSPANRKLGRVGKPYNYKEEATKKEEVSKDFRSEDKAFLADIESKIESKDKTEFNRLKNSLVEGRNLYNSGLNPSGKKMSEGELAAVTKSIDSTKQKLSKLIENKNVFSIHLHPKDEVDIEEFFEEFDLKPIKKEKSDKPKSRFGNYPKTIQFTFSEKDKEKMSELLRNTDFNWVY